MHVCDFFELCLLLPKNQNTNLASIAEERSKEATWRTFLFGKRAELLHRVYVVLDRVADGLKTSTEALNVLERLVSFSAELLQTMFELGMSPFHGEGTVKEEESRKC